MLAFKVEEVCGESPCCELQRKNRRQGRKEPGINNMSLGFVQK